MKLLFHGDKIQIGTTEYEVEIISISYSRMGEGARKEIIDAWDRGDPLAFINKQPATFYPTPPAATLETGDLFGLPEIQTIYRVAKNEYGAYEIQPTKEDYAMLNERINLFTR